MVFIASSFGVRLIRFLLHSHIDDLLYVFSQHIWEKFCLAFKYFQTSGVDFMYGIR